VPSIDRLINSDTRQQSRWIARLSPWAAGALLLPAAVAVVYGLSGAQLVPLDRNAYRGMVDAHRGKVILVDFWATWCDPCREELPKLVALEKRLDSRKFQLVTISADEPENQAAAGTLLDKEGVRPPHFIKHADDDQAFIDSVDKKWSGALPALFLYDASGTLAARFIGESDINEIETAVRKVLRPNPPALRPSGNFARPVTRGAATVQPLIVAFTRSGS
jgi:thiol-disulfide isomerase/thioredoxin